MGQSVAQYSDLPAGAVVYSDIPEGAQIVHDPVPYGGKTLEQRQADSKTAFEGAQPKWYDTLFNRAGLEKAKEQAGNVVAGIPQAVTGIPSAVIAAKDALNAAIGFGQPRSLAPAERMATSMVNPVMTPLKQAIELAMPGLVNAPSPDAPETAAAAQGAGALLGGAAIGEVAEGAPHIAGPAADVFNATKARMAAIDPTALKATAEAMRAAKPVTAPDLGIVANSAIKPAVGLYNLGKKITNTIGAAARERLATAVDARYPAVQGNMTLGPESYAAEAERPPVQGPSLPPPKEPPLETVGAVRPPAEEITPGKLSVWDQIRKSIAPASTPESASLNKQLGLSARDVEHGADAGSQIIFEKLLDPNKAVTKLHVDAALKDSGTRLDGLLKAADAKGYQIDAQTPTNDAQALAQKTIGKSSDITFDTKIQGIVNDMAKRGGDIAKDTGHTLEKLSPSEAFKLKSNLGDSITWKTNLDSYEAPENQMKIQIYRALNKQLKAIPDLGPEQFRWGNLKIGSDALQDSINDYKVGKGSLEFENVGASRKPTAVGAPDDDLASQLQKEWAAPSKPIVKNGMVKVVHYSNSADFNPAQAANGEKPGTFFYPAGLEESRPPFPGRTARTYWVPADSLQHISTGHGSVETFVPADKLHTLVPD